MKRGAALAARAVLAGVLAGSVPASAAEPSAGGPDGWVIGQAAYRPIPLPRSFANDKLRDSLEYDEAGPVRAFDLDLDGDGRPERFVAAAEKLCGTGGCPVALLDGRTQREVGRFFGTLVVLARRENGWAVLQTLGDADGAMTPLTTYVFERAQYQPADAALIDELARDILLRSLARKP